MSNYWNTLRRRQISRRTMLGASAKAGVGAAGLALVGCGDDDDDAGTAAAERAAAAAEEAAAAAIAAAEARAAETEAAADAAAEAAAAASEASAAASQAADAADAAAALAAEAAESEDAANAAAAAEAAAAAAADAAAAASAAGDEAAAAVAAAASEAAEAAAQAARDAAAAVEAGTATAEAAQAAIDEAAEAAAAAAAAAGEASAAAGEAAATAQETAEAAAETAAAAVAAAEEAADAAREAAESAAMAAEEEQAAPAGLAAYDLEGKVTVGWDAGPGSLDPGTPAGGSGSGSSNSQTHFDGMFKLNAQGGATQGGLLDWEFVDEGLGLLMTIPAEPRLFHSGAAITAEDVQFNWDRALGRAEYNPDFGGLAELPDIGDVTIVDASSVHLATPSPEVGLPPQAGGMQFFSKALIEENGDQWAAQNPIYGTGPFRFDGWTPDQEINSIRNDDYWQPRLELENPSGNTGLPYFKELTTTWIPEPQARIAALDVGEIDFAGQIPWDLAREFEGDEDFAIHTHSAARGLYVAFPKNKANNPLNPDEPNPFADKRVRIALNLAVNVQEIIDTIQTGREDFTYTLAVGQFGHHPEFPNVRWGFDPERAKALLAEAGYPDGFEMNIHHPSGLYTGVAQFMQAVANDLRDIGMTVNLFSEELNIYFENVENREQPNPFLFIEPANDPLFSIRLVTHSTGIFVHTNDGLPGSPGSDVTMEVDALAEQAYVEFDDAKREALLQELALKHYEDASWLYLFELIQPHVSTSRVLWPQFFNKPGAIEYSNFRLLKA